MLNVGRGQRRELPRSQFRREIPFENAGIVGPRARREGATPRLEPFFRPDAEGLATQDHRLVLLAPANRRIQVSLSIFLRPANDLAKPLALAAFGPVREPDAPATRSPGIYAALTL